MGATSSTQASADYLAAPLTNGFLQGYNTLDALAALAFGITGALVNFPGFLTKSVEFILHKATFRKQFYITCLL
ncbi:hypothetical protein HMPREF3168_05065 [Lactobacillus sp. HMSC08B12]|nr:hypothetical protein HMPREF3168_05065 [Lactobacillus sp. HMSC08B12]